MFAIISLHTMLSIIRPLKPLASLPTSDVCLTMHDVPDINDLINAKLTYKQISIELNRSFHINDSNNL